MEALLLIDIQNDYFAKGRFPLAGMDTAARNAQKLLADFRAKGLPVIHIRHVSLGDGAAFFRPDTAGSEIHPLVAPANGEIVLIKHYPNSFRETGLDAKLKGLGVTTIHVAGAQTNMCVDTTTRAGFDLGYRMVIHEGACAARAYLGTRLIHRITIKTLGSVFAEIAR
jgi:nicotinamidase-related amidase